MNSPRDSKESKKIKWTDKIGNICLLIEDELNCDCVDRGDHPCNLIIKIIEFKNKNLIKELEEIIKMAIDIGLTNIKLNKRVFSLALENVRLKIEAEKKCTK